MPSREAVADFVNSLMVKCVLASFASRGIAASAAATDSAIKVFVFIAKLVNVSFLGLVFAHSKYHRD